MVYGDPGVSGLHVQCPVVEDNRLGPGPVLDHFMVDSPVRVGVNRPYGVTQSSVQVWVRFGVCISVTFFSLRQ